MNIVAGAAIPLRTVRKNRWLGIFYTAIYGLLAAFVFSGKRIYDASRLPAVVAAATEGGTVLRNRCLCSVPQNCPSNANSPPFIDKNIFAASEFNLDLREQVGQLGFYRGAQWIFRSIVADVLFMQAHVAWNALIGAAYFGCSARFTTLQRARFCFWDMAAWHMAWNASMAAMNDRTRRASLRIKTQREYFALGKDFP